MINFVLCGTAGNRFVCVQQALQTFEEEQKHEAVRALKQTTELCKADYHKPRKSRRKRPTDVLLLTSCITVNYVDLSFFLLVYRFMYTTH